MNKININDPKAWQELDWDEPVEPELLKRSDATVARSRSALRKRDDPNFSATMSKVARERNRDSTYVENQLKGVRYNRDNTYQAESNARPEVKEKISKALKGVPKSAEAKKKYKEVKTNKYGDANYEAAHKAGLAKRDKPFHAGEYGVFPSIAEAARQVEEKGLLKNAYKKFSEWKKEGKKPNEYYFIEEK
jgi:hypothetical protein